MHEAALNIPRTHTLNQTSFKNVKKKSEDFDLYEYEELDGNGDLVARFEVKDSTSIYPPCNRYIEYIKYDSAGAKIEETRVSA
jgi:hypothetical protein